MRMLHLLTILVAAGCGEKNKPEPLSKTKSPLSEKVQHTNQDSKAKVRTPIWEFEAGGRVLSSPAIGSDGTVYVGSYDKKLYAIKTDSKGLAKSPWPMRGQNARHTGRAPTK